MIKYSDINLIGRSSVLNINCGLSFIIVSDRAGLGLQQLVFI